MVAHFPPPPFCCSWYGEEGVGLVGSLTRKNKWLFLAVKTGLVDCLGCMCRQGKLGVLFCIGRHNLLSAFLWWSSEGRESLVGPILISMIYRGRIVTLEILLVVQFSFSIPLVSRTTTTSLCSWDPSTRKDNCNCRHLNWRLLSREMSLLYAELYIAEFPC